MEHTHNHSEETLFTMLTEHLLFVLIALSVIAVIFVLSWLLEKYVLKIKKEKRALNIKKIACIGLFSAVGGVLATFEIPLPMLPGFYLLDFSDVACLITAFVVSPSAGVLTALLKTILHIVFHGTHSAFVGDFASFVMSCFIVLPSSMIYQHKQSRKTAFIGLVAGSVSLILLGGLFNGFYLIPEFARIYGMDIEAIVSMGTEVNKNINSVWTLVMFATIPFNLLKSVILSVVVYLIYAPLNSFYRNIH